MNQRLMRPTAALFPLVLLGSNLLGDTALTTFLFVCFFLIQICTLCSVDSFRIAAARESGVRRVDRRFSGTWPVLLVGAAIAAVFMNTLYREGLHSWIAPFAAALCIYIEHLFEERMYALSRSMDGMMLGIISNLLLLVGLMVDAGGGMDAPIKGFYTGCAAALSMVISMAVCYIMEPMRGFSLVPRSIAFFPKAMVQKMLFPALVIACGWFFYEMDLFSGLVLWELSRTLCRRTQDESRPLNLLLVTVCAVLVAASAWMPGLKPYSVSTMVGLLCAVVVYCAPSVRLYAGVVLLLGAAALGILLPLPEMWNHAAAIALCLAAVILNLRRAFMKRAKQMVYDFGE